MDCAHTLDFLDAYVDRELDLVKSLELERHLGDCAACSKRYASVQALRSAVREVYHQPPASLERRVASAIGKHSKRERPRRELPWRWITVWASAAVLVVVSWSAFTLFARRSPDELLAREVVSNHVRSLMAEHLSDVPSSDQHTVKPWFNGKLDFSPPVTDLTDEGFTLIGGRLDYLDGRAVAALVYQRRKHIINLFIWPSSGKSNAAGETTALQGYNVIQWRLGDMNCWAVSDLNNEELRQFVDLVKRKYTQAETLPASLDGQLRD